MKLTVTIDGEKHQIEYTKKTVANIVYTVTGLPEKFTPHLGSPFTFFIANERAQCFIRSEKTLQFAGQIMNQIKRNEMNTNRFN